MQAQRSLNNAVWKKRKRVPTCVQTRVKKIFKRLRKIARKNRTETAFLFFFFVVTLNYSECSSVACKNVVWHLEGEEEFVEKRKIPSFRRRTSCLRNVDFTWIISFLSLLLPLANSWETNREILFLEKIFQTCSISLK